MITPVTTTIPTTVSDSSHMSATPHLQADTVGAEHQPRRKSARRRNHHQTLIPGLPYNPGVEKYIWKAKDGFKTPSQSTAEIIRSELKTRWGKDIDPDNTFIVTLNYDPKQPQPRGGKVLNKISLTQAALHNVQRANKNDEHQTPLEKQRSTLHTWLGRLAPLLPLPAVVDEIDTLARRQRTYEGIFVGAEPGGREVYNSRNLLRQTPAAFRDIVWNTELSKPYTQFLNEFWPAHEGKYAQLSKASLVGAALSQFENDSLSASDTNLVMRAAGLPPNTTWENLKLDDLAPATTQDPSVEVGLLSINGFKSTDLLCITDKTPRFDADGKPATRTLLYIPGNSSPLHTFDSQAQMKRWLAEQAADPVKREALSMHFPLRDQADRHFSDGVNQTLVGLGGWSKKDAPDAGFLERLNEFDPQTLITIETLSDDPFDVMTQRQKARSYADAETEITTDGDVTKATILEVLETTTKVALMMTPLAMVMPEVAVGLELYYVAAGAVEVGVGADDLRHGKPGGADHIVFGVLNALPVIAGGATRLAKGEVAAGKTLGEALPPREPTVTERGIEQSPANRLRPSQAADISAYAVPDGEGLIEGMQPNSKGMYQVKDSAGADHWYIRYTDATRTPKVYEIKGNFKLSNDYAQIIDSANGKPVMIVHSDGKGGWARAAADGGVVWPWQRRASPTPSDDPKTPATFADEFLEIDGKKMAGAEKLDEVLRARAGTNFELSSRNFEENGLVKRRFNTSWNIDETGFAVEPGEKAQMTELSSSEYSPNFVLDINRCPYTVTTTENGLSVTTKLDAVAGTSEGIQRARLAQFEAVIPDAQLRARISEVAHQGSTFPAIADLHGGAGLQEGYYYGADNTHFQIDYDSSRNLAKVHVTSEGHLSMPEQDINRVPGVQVTIKRSFTIGEGNQSNSLYEIGKAAPTTIDVSVTANP